MCSLNTLEDYYNYWDRFVAEWKNLNISGITKLGWNLPEFIGDVNKVDTKEYLPEPWWGNDGTHIFKAVFLNLNPGAGGYEQHKNTINSSDFKTYRKYVSGKVDTFVNNKEYKIYIDNKYCKSTTEWLLTQRVNRFFNALEIYSVSVRNVLGVDLIPWHTFSFGSKQRTYIVNNAEQIFNNSIKFTLAASRQIDGVLKNVVIARVPYDLLERVFRQAGVTNNVISISYFNKSDSRLYGFRYGNEVYYIMSLTGARNNLPSKNILNGMIEKIKLMKNINKLK